MNLGKELDQEVNQGLKSPPQGNVVNLQLAVSNNDNIK